jgi:hypothetical protein
MSKVNMMNLPSKEESNPIEEGDGVIIIKPNGDIKTMSYGVDKDLVKAVSRKDPDKMNEQEQAIFLQGYMMFLLTMAASSNEIMKMLADIADQAELSGDTDKFVNQMH